MKVSEANKIIMDYHNAHSKKKIRSERMIPPCRNLMKFLETWKWITSVPMMYYPF